MSKVFIDTNILVYATDEADKKKQKRACAALMLCAKQMKGVISTQILQEFFVVATKKLGIDPLVAKDIISSYENFEVVAISPGLIRDAIDCHLLSKISFWDALVIMSAKSAGCQTLWSEDLSPGQVIQGVTVENPL